MSAALAMTEADAPGFWDLPHSSVELRQYLRDALVGELGCLALDERFMGHVGMDSWTAHRLTDAARGGGRSIADILFLVDELVAQVRREERAGGRRE